MRMLNGALIAMMLSSAALAQADQFRYTYNRPGVASFTGTFRSDYQDNGFYYDISNMTLQVTVAGHAAGPLESFNFYDSTGYRQDLTYDAGRNDFGLFAPLWTVTWHSYISGNDIAHDIDLFNNSTYQNIDINGLDGRDSWHVVPAPEPETYALMALGLVGVGLRWRRRAGADNGAKAG